MLTIGIGTESLLLEVRCEKLFSSFKTLFSMLGLILRGPTLNCSDRESSSLQKPAAIQLTEKHAWNLSQVSQKLRVGNLELNYEECMTRCLNCCVSARCYNTHQHLASWGRKIVRSWLKNKTKQQQKSHITSYISENRDL